MLIHVIDCDIDEIGVGSVMTLMVLVMWMCCDAPCVVDVDIDADFNHGIGVQDDVYAVCSVAFTSMIHHIYDGVGVDAVADCADASDDPRGLLR